jgi:hypothetical protein
MDKELEFVDKYLDFYIDEDRLPQGGMVSAMKNGSYP